MHTKQGKKDVFFEMKSLVDTLYTIFSDNSTEGKNKLVTILKQTLSEYTKPVNYPIQGYLYQRTRTRFNDINACIKNIEAATSVLAQVQQIKRILSHGAWEIESYNTTLFFKLINTIDAFNLPKMRIVHSEIIPRLSVAIMAKIQTIEKTHDFDVLSKQAIVKEMETLHNTKKAPTQTVTIVDSLAVATNLAREAPEKSVFHLFLAPKGWQLNWLDPYGKKHALAIEAELASLLKNVKIVNKITLAQLQKVQVQCLKAKDNFLERLAVVINPKIDLVNIVNVFVLNHQQNGFNLTWYDLSGHKKIIDLTAYPALTDFLSTVKEWTPELTQHLSSYLPGINIRTVLEDKNNFKDQLIKCLGDRFPATPNKNVAPKHQSVSSLEDKLHPQQNKLVNTTASTGRLDMKQFAKIEGLFAKKAQKPAPGRIDVSQFNHLASLFG